MYLAFLLLIPLIIGLASLLFSKGRVTILEFLTLEASCILVVLSGYFMAQYSATLDTEIWSARIVKKESNHVSCSHSYRCNCHTVGSGNNAHEECDTCYEHSYDVDWNIYTSSDETITIDRVDRQGVQEPSRWTSVYVGEPTAIAHDFTNYIKAAPNSILRRRGNEKSFSGLLPDYPDTVYDYYHCDRFVSVGFIPPDLVTWNVLLENINADLGAKKQVNIVLVLTKLADSSYEYALEEKWVGGKKNDVIIIVGVPEYPKIGWVRIFSWSNVEELKVELRDRILEIGTIDQRDQIAQAIKSIVDQKFVRKPMADFKYLAAGMQPGTVGTIILFLIGVIVSIGLQFYFYNNDPFRCGRRRDRSR